MREVKGELVRLYLGPALLDMLPEDLAQRPVQQVGGSVVLARELTLGADLELLRTFPGVEHRLELVGEWGGVRWYNDSKATNPDAGLVALRSFRGVPVVLIAGGYGGGFELGPWAEAVRERTRAAVLIGRLIPSPMKRMTFFACRAVGLAVTTSYVTVWVSVVSPATTFTDTV